METSSRLQLPYIMASQAQKHVTHNEAVRMLDCLVQPVVRGRTHATPPASPEEGDGYVVAAGATDAWSGKEGQIACYMDAAWQFFAPAAGWQVFDLEANERLAYSGTDWEPWRGGGSLPWFGVNADADATSRLAVKSDAALLSHDDITPGSGDMRLKLNKAATGNTASFLFQTDWSGRVEIGLTGDDKLHIKTSSDGATWREAIVIDPATGYFGLGGITSPDAVIDVMSSSSADRPNFSKVGDEPAGAGANYNRYRGTAVAPAALLSGDTVQNFFGNGYDGTGLVACANLKWILESDAATGDVPTRIQFNNFTSGVGLTTKLEIDSDGTARAAVDNAYVLGNSSYRWSAVWAANGTIQTSDSRDKDVVGDLAFAGAMVDAVDPVLFRWKIGGRTLVASATETVTDEAGNEVPKVEEVDVPGVRVHSGFLAQDLKAAMDASNIDFSAWGLDDKDDPDSRQWTRPDQLVAVLWAALKETRAEVAALKAASSSG